MIAADDRARILAQVLGTPSDIEVQLRLYVLRSRSVLPDQLSFEDLARLADSLFLAISGRSAARSLVEAGLGDALETGVQLRATLGPDGDRSIVGADVELSEVTQWLTLLSGNGDARPPIDVELMVGAVRRSSEWAAAITDVADRRGLAGLPVFWAQGPDPDEPYVPTSEDVGSIATVDGVLMLVNGNRLHQSDGRTRGALITLTEKLLAMQWTAPGWHEGAQVTPQWDDDFVGSFLASCASRGPCPTLDSTANLVSALVAAEGALGPCDLVERAHEAIRSAVNCILRWQAADGSWAIHAYDPSRESWTLPARTLSFGYAIEALAGARTILDIECLDAVERALAFARFTAEYGDDEVHWPMDFGPTSSEADLGATTWMVSAVAALGDMCGDQTDDLIRAAITYVLRRWEPDPAAYWLAEFRVPTWEGPTADPFTWELPLDPIVVSALLSHANEDQLLDHQTRIKLGIAAANFLAQCHPGGFWVDLLMAEEGDVRGMTGNSDFFQTALVDILRHQQVRYANLPKL